jgi:hypothetical protein
MTTSTRSECTPGTLSAAVHSAAVQHTVPTQHLAAQATTIAHTSSRSAGSIAAACYPSTPYSHCSSSYHNVHIAARPYNQCSTLSPQPPHHHHCHCCYSCCTHNVMFPAACWVRTFTTELASVRRSCSHSWSCQAPPALLSCGSEQRT